MDIPPTYFKTLAAEDVAQFHREMSPADRLGRGGPEQRKRGPGKARGMLLGPTYKGTFTGDGPRRQSQF